MKSVDKDALIEQVERDMIAEVKDLLGSEDFVEEYYRQMASGFIDIAVCALKEAWKRT